MTEVLNLLERVPLEWVKGARLRYELRQTVAPHTMGPNERIRLLRLQLTEGKRQLEVVVDSPHDSPMGG